MPEPDPSTVSLIRRVLSIAECGKPVWDPGQTFVYNDGTGGRKQCTLSVGFTADGGNLRKMLERYVEVEGKFAAQFKDWIAALKQNDPLTNPSFRELCRKAGKEDPLFMEAQEWAFDQYYLGPAFRWAEEYGFKEPLSLMVIADSFLHSGSMRPQLMNAFPEKKPSAGGNERIWIEQYCKARKDWLANHSNRLLRNTTYRVDCYLQEVAQENWSLDKSELVMNGQRVAMIS
jgi:Glycosyl hydrolase family 46